MGSHYSAIGLPLGDGEAELAKRVVSKGARLATARGDYYRLTDTSGAELWAQITPDGACVGLAPHFAGRTSYRLIMTERMQRRDLSPLDGSFFAWTIDPVEGDPTDGRGEFPLVFDTPDGAIHDELALPAIRDVQLAAFAHECEFAPGTSLAQATGAPTFSGELFDGRGVEDDDGKPLAQAYFSGSVLETRELVNGWTGEPFRWARVHSVFGELDVVVDTEGFAGVPAAGGFVRGTFWFSGRLGR